MSIHLNFKSYNFFKKVLKHKGRGFESFPAPNFGRNVREISKKRKKEIMAAKWAKPQNKQFKKYFSEIANEIESFLEVHFVSCFCKKIGNKM